MVERIRKAYTLVFVMDDEKVLLAMKKRGFGANRYNGPGGKLEAGETVEQAAQRELEEEVGIKAVDMVKCGEIEFSFDPNIEPKIMEVHVFRASQYEGQIVETEEMAPEWFRWTDVPFDRMWPDDKYWFSLLQQKTNFRAKFEFSDFNTIIAHELVTDNVTFS
jgi:mutator protein MutT